jgi:glycosyltransferase involved in cell wall biosynthesis
VRILLFTQYFPPEMGAPPARLFELATRLRDKGHTITVLTAMPNRPSGRIFHGYRGRMKIVENMEGIKVVRTWLWASKSAKFLHRLKSDLSFSLISALLGSWKLGKQDVVIYQNPPLFSVFNGYILGFLTRAKTVIWNGDIWPDILIQSGQVKEGFITRVMFLLQRFGFKKANLVAVTNPGAEKQILRTYPYLNTSVWSNGVDVNLFHPKLRSEKVRRGLGAGDKDFLVGYIGLHGRFQGLDVVLGAVELLRNQSNIKFFMMGDGVEKDRLMKLAKEKKLTNLIFHEPRPKWQIPPIVASCDACLVPLSCRMPGTMPSKVYEAWASGVPAIVSKGCEAESLVDEYNVGRTFEPMDAQQLRAAILDMAENHNGSTHENCRRLALRFDRDVLADHVHETLQLLHDDKIQGECLQHELIT